MRFSVIMFSTALLLSAAALTQAADRLAPASWNLESSPGMSKLPTISVPGIDAQVAREQDKTSFLPGQPLQRAAPRQSRLDVIAGAQVRELADGRKIARLRIQADGATDLNLAFSRFHMPEGAMLHIYDEQRSVFQGPWDSRQNRDHGEFWSPVVPGDVAIVEVVWSGAQPVLRLDQVFVGFRDLFAREGGPYVSKSHGACNIDVVCPEGDSWRDEIRSVVRIQVGGGVCSGTLINDAGQTNTPWILTADHCGIDANAAASVVVYWNFEAANCGDQQANLTDNQSGSALAATRFDVDMTLLKLDAAPQESFNVHFAGWTIDDTPPPGAVGIHHPSGDVKSISFAGDPLVAEPSCIASGGPDGTHWWVSKWDEGTTEPGSSGSAIFHPDSKQVVGFLSGGSAACSVPLGGDCYGRFDVGWDGANAASRLRDHLDPDGLISPGGGVAGVDPGEGSSGDILFADRFEST